MNLKALTWRPAPEGDSIRQSEDGRVVLRARDATVHGVMLRYEPAKKKNCLGYWINPNDWADWQFQVDKPGTFAVEVDQGCGKGQGDSKVEVQCGTQKLPFTVKDTGHFQNWETLRIGHLTIDTAGQHRLAIRPLKKAHDAVMDVQAIRLIPQP